MDERDLDGLAWGCGMGEWLAVLSADNKVAQRVA